MPGTFQHIIAVTFQMIVQFESAAAAGARRKAHDFSL
jgi:hypothetical protein